MLKPKKGLFCGRTKIEKLLEEVCAIFYYIQNTHAKLAAD